MKTEMAAYKAARAELDKWRGLLAAADRAGEEAVARQVEVRTRIGEFEQKCQDAERAFLDAVARL